MESLQNFMGEFRGIMSKIFIIADNMSDTNLNIIREQYSNQAVILSTKLGNSQSFLKCCNLAMNLPKDGFVYFCEDDYWHLAGSALALKEGFKIFDYVCLYDHPDKYKFFSGPQNAFAKSNKYSEMCEVVHSETLSWKTTNSCALTFGVGIKTLQEDFPLLRLSILRKKGPWGFIAFQHLTRQRYIARHFTFERILFSILCPRLFLPRRYIGVPLPGLAAHLEVTYTPYHFFSSGVRTPKSSSADSSAPVSV